MQTSSDEQENSFAEHVRNLASQDAEKRRDAVGALGWSGMKQAIPYLISALQDTDERVRRSAVWGLVELGLDCGSLLSLLSHANLLVRRAAFQYLFTSGIRDDHAQACASLSVCLLMYEGAGVRYQTCLFLMRLPKAFFRRAYEVIEGGSDHPEVTRSTSNRLLETR